MNPNARHIVNYILLIMCLFLASRMSYGAKPQEIKELTFLTWSDYMDPLLIEKFEKAYQAKVRIITYDSDDSRTGMLLATDGQSFDVAVIDGNSIEAYRRRGWLEPLSTDNIPNIIFIDQKWRTAYTDADTHAVPFFWGTTGIVYRSDMVSEPITSWMQIFKPTEELHGRIYMLPQSRELIDIALKTLGYSVNSVDTSAYSQVKRLLLEQKPYLKKYDIPALDEGSALIKGTVLAAASYSGDALMLMDIDKNIEYVTPKEGGVLWVDYLVVFAKSKNADLAKIFVNFLHEPENAAQLAQFVYYATPNREAEKLLPKEFLGDTTIYPPEEILKNYELEKKLPPEIYRIRTSIFAEVTNGKI